MNAKFALRAIDWEIVDRWPDPKAAAALYGHLAVLDALSKRMFIDRGLILLAIEERMLWKHLTDPATGQAFTSFERCICTACDYSRRDCFYALAAAKELRDIPRDQLAGMTRQNVEVLKCLSSGIRSKPEVIEAAQTMTERDFVAKVEAEFPDQHVEAKRAVVLPKGAHAIIDQAIDMAMALEGCKTRGEALEAVGAYFVTGCQEQYRKLIKEGAA